MATSMAKHGLTIAVNLRQNAHHIGCLQNISALLMPRCAVQTTCPLRTNYADWRMRRDAIRRQLTKEHSQERRLLNCIRKNTILPDEVKVMADQEIASLPVIAPMLGYVTVVLSRPDPEVLYNAGDLAVLYGGKRQMQITCLVYRELNGEIVTLARL
ncbi:uncharacterized protein [Amphiura filiformis]|uniref:uncharacterized protein n=1 Tax=Amphiura filiformis TaxID=82378 RepID=UPI003B21A01F